MRVKQRQRTKTASSIAGLVLLCIVGLMAASTRVAQQARRLEASMQANQNRVLGVAYQSKGYVLTIKKIQSLPPADGSGLQRVTVGLGIANTSDQVMQVSPGLQMSIVDSQGVIHAVTTQYLSDGQVIGGPILPGHTLGLLVDFAVPSDQTMEQFVFQEDAAAAPTVIRL